MIAELMSALHEKELCLGKPKLVESAERHNGFSIK